MAHFYGWMQGNRGDTTRMGNTNSGISAWVQSWQARISVQLGHHRNLERDDARITIGEGGYGNHRMLIIDIDDTSTVVEALGCGDERIDNIKQRIANDFLKLSEEAPKALKRVERKRKKEERERALQMSEENREEILSKLGVE